ncbi:MAG: hypothetical protein ACK5LN_13385 [Propioniciclava sp.]
MRIRSILSEAWRNTISGTSRALLLTLILGVVAGALAWLDLSTARGLVERAQEFQKSGASIAVVEAPGRIDGVACESLNQIPTVRAAGAIRVADRLTLPVLPDQQLPTHDVTTGFPEILGITVQGSGVVLPETLAETLGASVGEPLQLGSATTTVAGIYAYPDDGRKAGYSYTALAPVPSSGSNFDECWVDAWPPTSQLRGLLSATAITVDPTKDEPTTIGQLNTRLGATFDGPGQFRSRITVWAPVAALLAGIAVGYGSIRTRRLELSAAQHAGVSGSAQLLQLLLESMVWAIAAGILTIPVLVLAANGLAWADARPLAALGALSPLGAVLGSLAGTALGAARIRERDLFKHFKDR